MKTVNVCLFIFCFGLFFGCASFPNADKEHNTMVIGAINQQAQGYNYYGSATINGINTSGIEISIKNLKDENIYTMRTISGGQFYSINIPEGEYKISKLYIKKEFGSSWASISWTPPSDAEQKFEIINGKVNNLGTISWECEKDVKNRILYNREYGQVRDAFQEKNKSSNWNEKEWVDIKIIK